MGRKNIQLERRLQIIKALNRCLLKKPYKDTTIKDIAAESGINHGMLHYYFKDKEEILLNFVDYVLNKHKTEFLIWREKQDFSKTKQKQVLEAVFQHINEKITLNRNLSKVFVILWEIALNNRKVKARLKTVYKEWIELMVEVAGFPIDNQASHDTMLSIVAYLEGMALFSVIMNLKKEEHRQILLKFQKIIIESLSDN